jgi:hypothetical protein
MFSGFFLYGGGKRKSIFLPLIKIIRIHAPLHLMIILTINRKKIEPFIFFLIVIFPIQQRTGRKLLTANRLQVKTSINLSTLKTKKFK